MKLPIRVSEESREPIYHQIETQIKALIVGGQIPPGTPLPSIRILASELACSVITTRKAYQNLESSGFIKTIQGKGTFVINIERETKDRTKKKVVHEGFQKVLEQGKQLGFSEDEIRSIFNEVLDLHYLK
ncbi:GntR family transcriptional regulator [Ammoniphilus sp. CFH 90114]|nr:GntR family transcriptional regulator [Ammoniphilus sp. CFH 90114]RXT07296.1 GntR family transcriptional regulator [Ammoniphilus sp. CFH 90114]